MEVGAAFFRPYFENQNSSIEPSVVAPVQDDVEIEDIEVEEAKPESLSLQNNEKELIVKALEKHNGRRNKAAEALGISQRTLVLTINERSSEPYINVTKRVESRL
ncbi:hypothetical protein AWY89_10960 [Pasteurella multocida subsp. multocida]|nr:hypothetical protein AWY89_10960 [Pasteurella multocida subsp. multocida]